jgi:GntR family transcriptional regulator / MocR family aminotransferase
MKGSRAISPTISGVDLHLDLIGTRVREPLERALRDAVQSGRLHPGTRLPSTRALAADLGIARNTVTEVYEQLVAEGWLVARQGSGTVVADRMAVEPGTRTASGGTGPVPSGTGPAVASRGGAARPRYDLTPGTPDVSAFPRNEWLAAARRAWSSAPAAAFGYAEPAGLPAFRTVLAGYLARARGVRASVERIVVCSGYIQALALLSTALRVRGIRTLAVESYGLGIHWEVIAATGVRTAPVPVDSGGAQVEHVWSGTPAGAVLLTPAHQFPTGVVLAPDRRAAVVDWASQTGGLVIEDDYDGEFRYDRQPVGALQALDPERVVYVGTVSKSLAPGLRLAWAVVPPEWMEPVLAAKRVADLHTGTFEQLVLAEFIASGHYDRHVRRSRLRYRRRRDRLVSALTGRVPQVTVSGIAAGLHVLVDLPGAAGAEQAAVAAAARHGLRINGLGVYRHPGSDRTRQALVAGYGTPPEHGFAGAVEALCASLGGAETRRPPSLTA